MQRQSARAHQLPSEASLWHVFWTGQIFAAKAEKDCIKGKKGTQTVQNRPEFMQTAVQSSGKKYSFLTAQNQTLSGPVSPSIAGSLGQLCRPGHPWVPWSLEKAPLLARVEVPKLGSGTKVCQGRVVYPLADKTGTHCTRLRSFKEFFLTT